MVKLRSQLLAGLKKATIEMLLLKLLAEQDMYGYQMTQQLKKRSNGLYTVLEGSMYPILYRLEEQGYIETSGNTTVDGRARSYYEITLAGRDYLSETLANYQMISGVFVKLMEGSEKFDL